MPANGRACTTSATSRRSVESSTATFPRDESEEEREAGEEKGEEENKSQEKNSKTKSNAGRIHPPTKRARVNSETLFVGGRG